MRKPKVDQTLYSLNVGNAARRSEQKLTPVIVTKVGRKYFTCSNHGMEHCKGTQYHISDWREKTEYCQDSCLYEDPQAWKNEKESSEICKRISGAFQHSHNTAGLSLDDLIRIDRIIADAAE